MSDFVVKIILSASSPIPYYDVAPWELGTLEASSGEATTGDSYGLLVDCSPVGEYADIAQGGNYVAVGDWTVSIHAVTPGRVKWWDAFRAAGASMYGARVELWDVTNSVCRAVGVVTDAALNGVEVQIECESILTALHKDIPARRLTKAEFPGISTDSEGRAVPSIYGSVSRISAEAVQYDPEKYSASILINSDYPLDGSYKGLQSTAGLTFSASSVDVITTIFRGPSEAFRNGILPLYLSLDTFFPGISFWINSDTYGNSVNKKVYIKISGGTGSGQIRLISSITSVAVTSTKSGNSYATATVTTSSPWDTVPDKTSVFEFFKRDTWGNVVVGDEAEISSISYEIGKKNFPIAFDQGESNGIVLGDLSSEFVNGEDFAALSYLKPGDVYGNAYLSDGITTGNVGKLASAVAWPGGSGDYCGDVICRAKMTFDQIPDFNGEEPSLYAMFSFKELDYHPAQRMRLIWRARYFDDTVVVPDDESTDDETISGDAIIDFNAYTPACSFDGAKGNFEAFAVKIDLPRSVYAYESIRFGLMPVLDFTVEATLDTPPSSPVTTLPYMVGTSPIGAFSGHAGEFAYWSGSAWSFYAVPNTALTIVPNAIYTTGDASHLSIPPGYGGDLTGKYIKLTLSLTTADPLGKTYYYKDRFLKVDEGLKSSYEDWRKITGWYYDSGTGRNIVTLETPLDSSFIYGTYRALIAEEAKFLNYIEREAGFAFLYGSIPADSTYIVDLSSGRTYSASWPALPSGKTNGDPIMLARDAALDVLYRDLSIGSGNVDFASFQALPPNGIAAAMVEPERSDSVIARMAQEYNWIVAHDGAGRVRAKTWLDRMWSTVADWTIANSDIIAQSMQEKTTAIDDVICQPSLYWSWTQADGFRSCAIVSDVTVDPDSLTSRNYLGTIFGFGDFEESKDVLQSLQDAYSVALHRGEKSLYWTYGGDALILYVGSSRMWWAASRKRLLDFKVHENHAAMASVVGDRVKVTHRRATAGIAVYGTLAGRWWHPVDGTVQLLVMLDPPYVDLEDGLFVDTIDPSGTVEQYIDQTDGTSEQYTDSIGATA